MSENIFAKRTSVGIEEDWCNLLKDGFISAREWESFLSQFSTSNWRPDTSFRNKNFIARQTSLAERWFSNAPLEGMQDFFIKVKSAYPDMNGLIATRAAMNGMMLNDLNHSGESSILKWIELFKENIKASPNCLQALLNHSIEKSYLGVAKFLLQEGASPQGAFHLVMNQAALSLLSSYGSLDVLEAACDVRNVIYKEAIKRNIDPNNDSVWHTLNDGFFDSTVDKKKIIIMAYESTLFSDRPSAMKILKEKIESVSRNLEVMNLINASGEDVWNWKFDGNKTLAMVLSQYDRCEIISAPDLECKPPANDEYFKQRCNDGWSALMYGLYGSGLNRLANIYRNIYIEKEMFDASGITPAEIATVMKKICLNGSTPYMKPLVELGKIKDLGINLKLILKELENTSEKDGDSIPERLLLSFSNSTVDYQDAAILASAIGKLKKDSPLILNSPSWSSLDCVLKIVDFLDEIFSPEDESADIDVVQKAEKEIERCWSRGSNPYDWLKRNIDASGGTARQIISIAEKMSLMKGNNISNKKIKKVSPAL